MLISATMPKWSDGNTDVANLISSSLSLREQSGLRGQSCIGNSLVPSNRSSCAITLFDQHHSFVVRSNTCTRHMQLQTLTRSEMPCTITLSKRTCFSSPDCSRRIMLERENYRTQDKVENFPRKFSESYQNKLNSLSLRVLRVTRICALIVEVRPQIHKGGLPLQTGLFPFHLFGRMIPLTTSHVLPSTN